MTLASFFSENPMVALGFSGGADSSYLLYAGLKYGAQIKAYFVKSQFQPEFELQDALQISKELDTEITVLEMDILDKPWIASNPVNRCYYCKRAIFEILIKQAAIDGTGIIIDGTNASDDAENRPGMRALTELDVRSPLRECGITKAELRHLSKEAGLFTWDKPAYACLATRIPAGSIITDDLLRRVENAEKTLLYLGFKDFRIRVLGEAARLQLAASQIERAIDIRAKIVESLKAYFSSVLLDLEDR